MFPVLLFLLFFSIAAAYYFNEKRKIKNRLRHKKVQEKQQDIIDRLRAKKEPEKIKGPEADEERAG